MNFKSDNLIKLLILVSTGVLGLSMLLMGGNGSIKLMTDFYGLSAFASVDVFSNIAAISFIAIAVLSALAIKNDSVIKPLSILLMIVGLVPVIALFSSKMWIASLGGFPAIGAGQGVIKYFALLSIGIILFKPDMSNRVKAIIAAFPVVLVLLWIGGMKFTGLEAKGIEDLVSSSPLMSWMYVIWDIQTASNLIGIYDLIAAMLVATAVFKPKLLLPAVLMSGAVFAVTQTFMVTWNGALSADTLLATGGHFLIKDLWFIVNLMMFIGFVFNKK